MDGVDYAATQPIPLDAKGRAAVSVPVLLPESRVALRVVAGLPKPHSSADGSIGLARAELSIRLRFADGSPDVELVRRFAIEAAVERAPLPVLLVDLPAFASERIGFFDIAVEGPPAGTLHLISMTIDRP
jgi:hypothetical protein